MYSQNTTPLKKKSGQIVEIKLSGVGFRSYAHLDRTVMSVGYSHLIAVWTGLNLSSSPLKSRRQRLLLDSRWLNRFQSLKYPDPYRQRGMQNLSTIHPPKTKEGKKR